MHQSPICILEIYDNASRPYRSWLRLPSFLCIAATASVVHIFRFENVPCDCTCDSIVGKCPYVEGKHVLTDVRLVLKRIHAEQRAWYALILFPLQELKCPSQATHVHNQTTQFKPWAIIISAMSVMDFRHVRPREEPVLICWTVTLEEIVDFRHGMIIPTPLWCWTFP